MSPAPALRSRRPFRWFLTGDMARLVRAYLTSEIAVEGSRSDVLKIGITIAGRLGKSSLMRSFSRVVGGYRARNPQCRGYASRITLRS
jgi:hypothetical protein